MSGGQLMIDVEGLALTVQDRDVLCHPLVAGVTLFARNYRSPGQLRDLCSDIHSLRAPTLIIAVDQEGGRVQRFMDGFTRLPPAG
ncbi:MAG: beta-N-acetylhexosaminidase, partial [Chromatiales bacterium]|nr:beta-N-acetylhexosaminidase [Chromatiales bacterium]